MKSWHLPLDASRVTLARTRAGIPTVTELARKASLQRSHLQKVINGQRPATPFIVGRLAEVLGVEVGELLHTNGQEGSGEAHRRGTH